MKHDHTPGAHAGWGQVVLTALALAPVMRAALPMAGALLLARGLPKLLPKAARRPVSLRKTLTVAAPVDQVFDLWSRPENFPRFMGHVEAVRRLSERRSRWTVRAPAGQPAHWETELVAAVPHELVAWRTVAGSPLEHRGIVRLQPAAPDVTRIDVNMSYTPPAGAVGDGVAAALGIDPQQAIDEDLRRLKSLLENGRRAADDRAVRPAKAA
jgi:uncharacterized membrane protein